MEELINQIFHDEKYLLSTTEGARWAAEYLTDRLHLTRRERQKMIESAMSYAVDMFESQYIHNKEAQ